MKTKFTGWRVIDPLGAHQERYGVQFGADGGVMLAPRMPNNHERAHLIAAAPDGFAIAEAAYIALLKIPLASCDWRHANQHIYAGLRDYIAKATNQEAEAVQNHYEELVLLQRLES